jgi:hypothetical protein
MPMNMVGTPQNTVTRWFLHRAQHQVGIEARQQHLAGAAGESPRHLHVWPKVWNSGQRDQVRVAAVELGQGDAGERDWC